MGEMEENKKHKNDVLYQQNVWGGFYFYQKSDVLYQITFAFCDKYLPLRGDRTRDQMIQAARSGKQNIVEGMADGVASTEMMLKLLNVGRSSIQELREDYEDYLKSRGLQIWTKEHPRYDKMLKFCRTHNKWEDYQPYLVKWSAEEYCNTCISLCHMVDKMMITYLQKLEQQFVTQGGIRERMHKARTNYRKGQDEELAQLRVKVTEQKKEIERLKQLLNEKGIKY